MSGESRNAAHLNEIQRWFVDHLPRDEDLERPELAELAAEFGDAAKLWRPLVRHDQDQRIYFQLFRDTHLDAWLICWLDDQKTGYHDHDVSSGAVHVCEGALAEDRFAYGPFGVQEATRRREVGETFDFDAGYIHGVRHAGGPPATSIHCYSPPLWRMGYYESDSASSLVRTSITYLDEVAEATA
jgi:hypothetical protein